MIAPMTTALASTAPSTFGHHLNPAQLRAATFRYPTDSDPNRGAASGPLLIVAGAGTGKTNTLAHRVAHLVLLRREPGANSAADIHPTRGARDAPTRARTAARRATRCAVLAVPSERNALDVVGHVSFDRDRLAARHAGTCSDLDPGFWFSIAAMRPT